MVLLHICLRTLHRSLKVPLKLVSMLTRSSSGASSIESRIAYFVCGSVGVGCVGIVMCINGV